MRIKKTKTAPRGERGSETVEAGLVLVLTFALMFLLIDLAMSIFVKATLQQAVRQGVRFAITAQNLPSKSYLNDSITATVQQNALGLLNGTNGACKISINYFTPAGSAGTAGSGNIVQVAINGYSFTPLGPVLKSANPVGVSATASDVMEACPVAGCPPAVNPVPPTCP
jgi:Flp pilus assembly protein TadG